MSSPQKITYRGFKPATQGVNDLASKFPEVASQWHPTRNEDITPDQVPYGSGKKFWWTCARGHEWESTVAHRTTGGRGCPFCSGRLLVTGVNDFKSSYPDIAAQWNYKRNEGINPEAIFPSSKEKVWWICEKGHEWQGKVASRTTNKGGCPCCAGKYLVPGVNDLASTHPEIAAQWHPTRNGDLTPELVKSRQLKKVWWLCENGHDWFGSVAARTDHRNLGCPYCHSRKVLPGFNDLKTKFPEIAEQWHPTRNGDLTPSDIMPFSNKNYWWICSFGHEWQATAANRAGVQKTGCPICSNHKVVPGENDLESCFPEIAKQWHPTKNGDLLPSEIAPHSAKKCWWLCNKGHEWSAFVHTRTGNNKNGCPHCAKSAVTPNENDLLTLFPEVAAQWHPTKNGDRLPSDVRAHSGEKCWWRCSLGHEWRAIVSSRTGGDKNGCPICAHVVFLEGFNDLKSLYPHLAAQWHPTKNGDLRPEMFRPNSRQKVWWQCDKDKSHEWETQINTRAKLRDGAGCPYCSGSKVSVGVNDLQTKRPEIAAQWHPTKNGSLTPSDVSPGSAVKAWWICEKGHVWKTYVFCRTDGSGCPSCSGRVLIKGENDLATVYPDLAAQWHPVKNGELTPEMVTSRSGKRVWWQCAKDSSHEWSNTVNHRVSKKSGCPFCANRRLLPGFNDLMTKFPEIAAQWHPTKNGDLVPQQVFAFSSKTAWWLCSENHVWRTKISGRTKHESNCPFCQGVRKHNKPMTDKNKEMNENE